MSKKKIRNRCLVIDASVARAAGPPESMHPTGALCRDFLMEVRGICHRIAWTQAIKREWDKHESSFARQWRVSMFNLKKMIVAEVAGTGLEDSIREHCQDANIAEIVLKDCHLVDAALATDARIASLDDQVRGHFVALAAKIGLLRPILWVNPAISTEMRLNGSRPCSATRRTAG